MTSINNICLINGQRLDFCPSTQTFEIGENEHLEIVLLHVKQEALIRVMLNGEGASCNIKCVYLSNKNNQNKIDVEVIHQHKNTRSNQLIQGVATDKGRVSFKGVIRIPKDAQKCEGMQNHRGILLSPEATISAVPELEIYADDVKCAHGSAIGAPDASALFYLRTRGIDEKTAHRLLLTAFLCDILPEALHQTVKEWVNDNV